jgi:integrase
MIPFAVGTGARKSEQLNLKLRQVDFFRNLIVFDKTKSGRSRIVEMNSELKQILLALCKDKRPDDYFGSIRRRAGHSRTPSILFPTLVSMQRSKD